MLLPALSRGRMLGAYDWLSQYGLTEHAGTVVRDPFSGDQITQMIPWTNLAWSQVHQGHVPLWNPWSALGMPLAFNWQSATFSLPALVGYAAPLRYAYTVQVIVTLWVAGSGAYFLGGSFASGSWRRHLPERYSSSAEPSSFGSVGRSRRSCRGADGS